MHLDNKQKAKLKFLSFATILAYIGSLSIVIIASIIKTNPPLWGGIVDIFLLCTLFIQAILIKSVKPIDRTKDGELKIIYNIVLSVPLILLTIWFVFPHLFKWDVLLAGLAWRSAYFMAIFPDVLKIWKVK